MVILSGILRRKHLFHKAKIAEEAKSYGHMVRFMKEIVQMTHKDNDISPKERFLLGAAFKNLVAEPREALRFATNTANTQSWYGVFTAPVVGFYLNNSKAEIAEICADIIELIDRRLFPSAATKESKVYYLTLKGEFIWYLAEIQGPEEGMLDEEAARSAYIEALHISKDLDGMNPTVLFLMFSVAENFFKFYNSPLDATLILDQVLQYPAVRESEKNPAVSFLTFEGGFQMLADLLTMKQKIVDQIRISLAGPSNIPTGGVARHL